MADLINDKQRALAILEQQVQQDMERRGCGRPRNAIATSELRRCVYSAHNMQQQNIDHQQHQNRAAMQGPAIKANGLISSFKKLQSDRFRVM